jgi:hypothetical protein
MVRESQLSSSPEEDTAGYGFLVFFPISIISKISPTHNSRSMDKSWTHLCPILERPNVIHPRTDERHTLMAH